MSHANASEPQSIREASFPLDGRADDYDALLDGIGDARVVLLGEATHGTREFYRERTRITRRLIEERGFDAVAVEADWPDAYRVNRWVRGDSEDADADEALAGFRRFPAWMWRNTEVVDFVRWLREHNAARAAENERVGFYGLDLYSLFGSIEAVLAYLGETDPEAAHRARERYACFDHFGRDAQSYGQSAGLELAPSCEAEVVDQLLEMRRRAAKAARRGNDGERDDAFAAEQNALVVRDAEAYYRTLYRGHAASWNLRDGHMADVLRALVDHLRAGGGRGRVVVWAHNSHVGDARATEVAERGELNVGQLVRERFGDAAVNVGFTTHAGTVTAASSWGGPAERKRVRPSLPESYETVFHQAGPPRDFLLLPGEAGRATQRLARPHLERAIGVIYLPRTERQSHYFHARLPAQFDAVIHIDQTHAVEPLERTSEWTKGEPPETYPSGI